MSKDSKNHNSFYDDVSYVDDLADNTYIFDSQYQKEGSYSEHASGDLKNQTPYDNPATSLYDPNNMSTMGRLLSQYGTEDPVSADINNRVARLSCVDPLKPLYDPSSMMKEYGPNNGEMMPPMMQSLIQHHNTHPMPFVDPANSYVYTDKPKYEYADSEYYLNSDFDNQVANLSYGDSLQPLYDPNSMMGEYVSHAGGVTAPIPLPLNNENYAAPMPIEEPTNSYVISEAPNDQIVANLGEFVVGHDSDTVVSEASPGKLGGFSGNYGTDTNELKSEYADSEYNISANAEKQIAPLSYYEPVQPLFVAEENVSNVGEMTAPMMLALNDQNYAGPVQAIGGTNSDVIPKSNPKDYSREQRIRELKNEIDELDLKVESEKLPQSKGCCACCPTSRKGKLIVLFIVLFFLGILGILTYVFFPKYPDIKLKQIPQSDAKFFLLRNPQNNTFGFNYTFTLEVNVSNNNRFDIKPEAMSFKTYIKPNMPELRKTTYPGRAAPDDVGESLFGSAEEVGQRIFPAQSTTSFNITLNVNFNQDLDTGLDIANDPILGEILRVCHPSAISKKKLDITYIVYAEVAIFQRLGLPRLRQVSKATLTCPFPAHASALFKEPMLAPFVANSTNSTQ
jgi:hypothetical protein